MSAIHVFVGTKAQYIKTAPVLRLMQEQGIAYRLIDSGQHAALSVDLRRELGVKEPDVRLGGERDITSIPQAIGWALRLLFRMRSRAWILREVFGGQRGVCVVHGDTPSTLLSTVMARRAGLDVAHLEAGLRSHSWWHPFPEELIRILVMRRADLLFAPNGSAVDNLEAMKVRGRVVPLSANTSVEAVSAAAVNAESSGPAIVTMHRVENLHRRTRREGFQELVKRLTEQMPVRFIVHGPTERAIGSEVLAELEASGVDIRPLAPYAEFVQMLAAAPLVVTDGGSIQEECAILGVPTLLWRDRTERSDGLNRNVVLSHYDGEVVGEFLHDHRSLRTPPATQTSTPSKEILAQLVATLD